MLSLREQFICLLDSKPLEHADVIVCLEGGGLCRAGHAAKLWKEERARLIVVTGGLDKPPFSIPAYPTELFLMGTGVPSPAMVVDNTSMNTREQATTTVELMRKHSWRSALLVASDYHQYRAYLTFIKAMQEADDRFRLIPATVRNVWAPDMLAEEFAKIETYQAKGHCASFADGIEHLCA